MNGVDLEKALQKTKRRHEAKNPDRVLASFRKILTEDDKLDDSILANIFSGGGEAESLSWQQLNGDNIYTLGQIKDLCTQFRLRFLDARHFKGELPYEAISKVKALQKGKGEDIKNFKIVAPAPMFNLQYKDKDPLLFIPLGGQRFYLVHKWGNDLHPLRKLWVFPFRDFKSLLMSVAFLAAFIVMCVPSSIMMGPYDDNSLALRVVFFFYLFIAFSGLTALYGFSRMKNFNSELWNSKYMD